MTPRKRVHVTDHALSKGRHGLERTHLWFGEIRDLVARVEYVTLGVSGSTTFLLIWDHLLEKAVVLLVHDYADRVVVISIWETHYIGIPNGEPTEEQIHQAYHLATNPEAP